MRSLQRTLYFPGHTEFGLFCRGPSAGVAIKCRLQRLGFTYVTGVADHLSAVIAFNGLFHYNGGAQMTLRSRYGSARSTYILFTGSALLCRVFFAGDFFADVFFFTAML